jgi:hypothetical protein
MRFSRQEATYAALEKYLKEAREVARQQQKAKAEKQLAEALEKLAGGGFNPRQKVCIYPLSAKLALEGKLEHDEEKPKKSLLPEL